MNLTLKRLLTSVGCLLPMIIFLFVVGLVLGCAIAGGIAGAANQANAGEAGARAGEQFAQAYTGVVFVVSIFLGFLVAFGVSFSGLFPWCRKKREALEEPPPLGRY